MNRDSKIVGTSLKCTQQVTVPITQHYNILNSLISIYHLHFTECYHYYQLSLYQRPKFKNQLQAAKVGIPALPTSFARVHKKFCASGFGGSLPRLLKRSRFVLCVFVLEMGYEIQRTSVLYLYIIIEVCAKYDLQ